MNIAEAAQYAAILATVAAVFFGAWNLSVGGRNLANSESDRYTALVAQERDLYKQRWEDCMGGRPTPPVPEPLPNPQHGLSGLTIGAAAGGAVVGVGLAETILNAIRHGGWR